MTITITITITIIINIGLRAATAATCGRVAHSLAARGGCISLSLPIYY